MITIGVHWLKGNLIFQLSRSTEDENNIVMYKGVQYLLGILYNLSRPTPKGYVEEKGCISITETDLNVSVSTLQAFARTREPRKSFNKF